MLRDLSKSCGIRGNWQEFSPALPRSCGRRSHCAYRGASQRLVPKERPRALAVEYGALRLTFRGEMRQATPKNLHLPGDAARSNNKRSDSRLSMPAIQTRISLPVFSIWAGVGKNLRRIRPAIHRMAPQVETLYDGASEVLELRFQESRHPTSKSRR